MSNNITFNEVAPEAKDLVARLEHAAVEVVSHGMTFGAVEPHTHEHVGLRRWEKLRDDLATQLARIGYIAFNFASWAEPVPRSNGLHFDLRRNEPMGSAA